MAHDYNKSNRKHAYLTIIQHNAVYIYSILEGVNIKINKLNNNKGSIYTIEVLVFIAVAAIIASIVIPKYDAAFSIRNTIVTENFKSTDTIIE